MTTRRAIRVLWLVKGLGPGGMERLLVHQARRSDPERFRYRVAYLVERPESVVGELAESGVEAVRLTRGSALDPRWVLRLRDEVSTWRADVVHAHSAMPASLARVALRTMRHRPRLVYTEHATWDCYRWPTRAANALTYPLDDGTVAVSDEVRRSVPGVLRGRVRAVTHGIDPDALRNRPEDRDAVRAELGAPPGTVVVLTVAHLRREKAHEVLVEAAAGVLRRHPDVLFVLAGHGPRRAELEELVERLGLGGQVRLLGYRSDVDRLLAAADVFCLSSRQEGLPLAYMEAATVGLPTVATRVGGLAEHVRHGEDGLLVPPEDPAALADAIGQLVADAGLRERMGAAAARSSGGFDVRAAVRELEAAYEGVVSERSA